MVATRRGCPVLDALCGRQAHTNDERLLVLVAHPDDEVIAVGGQLRDWRGFHIGFATDGAPADPRFARRAGCQTRGAYRRVRLEESERALATARVPPCRVTRLGYEDLELAQTLPAVVRAVERLVDAVRPTAVLTHAYEGGHPDHDALALAVARASLPKGLPRLEFAGYHAGPHGLVTGRFLPEGPRGGARRLTPAEEARKRTLLDCFASQRDTLSSFPRDVERFRRAPDYDFAARPHDGPLWYEQLGWGLDWAAWRDATREGGGPTSASDRAPLAQPWV